LTGCADGGDDGSTGGGNQTPVAGDYTIGNTTQTANKVTAVSITPKPGKSPGALTIYYEGTRETTYPKDTEIPQAVGFYTVTFDVAAATGWNAAPNLSAGELEVNNNKTPKADDYTFGNMNQTEDSVTAVTITKTGTASPGNIVNIQYNGSAEVPQTGGTYAVTFDVEAAEGWNAMTGLSAGNLVVSGGGSNKTPTADDYTFGNMEQAAGSVTAVTIAKKDTASPGNVVNIQYSGSAEVPQTGGTYAVTFDVEAATGWNPATGLSAGNLTVGGSDVRLVGKWYISGSSTEYFDFQSDGTLVVGIGYPYPNTVTGSYTASGNTLTMNIGTDVVVSTFAISVSGSTATLTITADGTTQTYTRSFGSPLSNAVTVNRISSVVGIPLTAIYFGDEPVTFQWKNGGTDVGTPSTANPNIYTPTTAGIYTVTVSAEGFQSKSATVFVSNISDGYIVVNITGLTPGTRYYFSPQKGTTADQWSIQDSDIADSSGTFSFFFSIAYLSLWGYTGNCYILYTNDRSKPWDAYKTISTYNMDSPATYTLNAATHFGPFERW
jgi:hypothetical protein